MNKKYQNESLPTEVIYGGEIGDCSYRELAENLARISSLLSCKRRDLVVVQGQDYEYMTFPKTMDHPILNIPQANFISIIRDRLHQQISRNPSRLGATLYSARNNQLLKYIKYFTFDNQGHPSVFTIVPKKNLKAFYQHIRTQNKKIALSNPPLLADGLLEEIVESTIGFLLKRRELMKYNVHIKRGIILSGPPGNGKTMLCKWIKKLCNEHNLTYGSSTGQGITMAFQQGHSLTDFFTGHNVKFLDDVDIGMFADRDNNSSQAKLSCAILSAMDGLENSENVVRIFTTNEKIDGMDGAFLRPGRIDRNFEIKKPNEEIRRKFITSWTKEIVDYLSKRGLINELVAASHDKSFAELDAFKSFLVFDKIMYGKFDFDKAIKKWNERLTADVGINKVGFK